MVNQLECPKNQLDNTKMARPAGTVDDLLLVQNGLPVYTSKKSDRPTIKHTLFLLIWILQTIYIYIYIYIYFFLLLFFIYIHT